jgi:hypothetical protein
MATNRGQISVTVSAGSTFEVASWLAAASLVGSGVVARIDRMLIRPVVGSAVWTDDPTVPATALSASVGVPIGAADSTLPLLVPGDPRNFKLKALGATVLTCLFYEGGIISVS